AGMDRLVRHNVLALSGRAVEASGDVDVLLLDKTGTITLGNREATRFIPMPGIGEAELAEAAQLASLADETPEGRSIVVPANGQGDPRAPAALARGPFRPLLGRNPEERGRRRRQPVPQGRRRRGRPLRRGAGWPPARRAAGAARPDRPRGRHAAGRLPRQPR